MLASGLPASVQVATRAKTPVVLLLITAFSVKVVAIRIQPKLVPTEFLPKMMTILI